MPLEELNTRPGAFLWEAYPGQVIPATWGDDDDGNAFPDGFLDGRTFEVRISNASGIVDTIAAVAGDTTVTAEVPVPAETGRYLVGLWDTTDTPQIATWAPLHVDDVGAAPPAGLTIPIQVVYPSLTIPIDFHIGGGGAPSGPAGGVLGGTYPDPTFAVDMATQAELDANTVAWTAAITAAVDALKNGAPASGDTLNELHARLAVIEALGSLATDAELIAAVASILGSADTDGDTLGELQALIGLRLLKSANLSDVPNVATARTNLSVYSIAAVDALFDALDAHLLATYAPLDAVLIEDPDDLGTYNPGTVAIGTTDPALGGPDPYAWLNPEELGPPADYVPEARTLTAGDGLDGGGDLSANRTIDVDATVLRTTGAQAKAGVLTFTDDPVVPAEAFGAGWNGSNEPPTKNDVYDELAFKGGGNFRAKAGDWSHPHAALSATITMSLNEERMIPLWVPPGRTIDKLAIEITTFAASSAVRLGIRLDDDGWPGTLHAAGASTADSTSNGVKQVDIATTAAISGRWVWLVAKAEGGTPVTYRLLAPTLYLPVRSGPSLNGGGQFPYFNGSAGAFPSSFGLTRGDPCQTAAPHIGARFA